MIVIADFIWFAFKVIIRILAGMFAAAAIDSYVDSVKSGNTGNKPNNLWFLIFAVLAFAIMLKV